MAESSLVWSARYYRPEDDEQLLELLKVSFDGWPKVEVAAASLDHLRWKLASPLNAWRQNIVGEAAGRVIATRLYVLRDGSVCGRPMVCKLGIETCVQPSYRNAGIMSALNDFGGERLGEIDVHLLYSGHPALLRIRKRFVVLPFRGVSALVCSSNGGRSPAQAPWTIEQRGRFDSRVDVLWEEARQAFGLLLDRRQEFLNWRYCDPRGGAFNVVTAEQDGRILGYVVTRVSNGEGYVADLLALPGRLDVVDSLLADAIASLRAGGVERVECWTSRGHPYEEVLARRGFDKKKRTLRFSFRPCGASLAELTALRDPAAVIHLMPGDTDIV